MTQGTSHSFPAVDGGYSDWLESSECTASCGGGTLTVTRTCTNPPPFSGGKDCSSLGPAKMTRQCNTQECCMLSLRTIILILMPQCAKDILPAALFALTIVRKRGRLRWRS